MDAHRDTTAKSAIAHKEEEPSSNQHLKVRGRSNSPPWRKGLVYDCEQQVVKVQSEKKINIDHCQKVDLPPKRKHVTIFVDPETGSKPTIARKGADGQNNVELATLNLNRLGVYHQVLRFLGLLSTLYVMNAAPLSKKSSQVIRNQSPGGAG